MAATIPVIDENTWARIVAKAYIDDAQPHSGPSFLDVLETDPKAAVDTARHAPDLPLINIPDQVRLMDLYYSYSTPANPDPIADLLTAIFQGSDQQQLQDLIKFGTFLGKPVTMPPGEWINPFGPIKLFEHAIQAISLKNWMRIYAYIWYQIRFAVPPNTMIESDFEKNPVDALVTYNVIANINTLSVPSPPSPPAIIYNPRLTPLFSLGDPPPDTSGASPPLALTDIRNALDAHSFRHRIRMCC